MCGSCPNPRVFNHTSVIRPLDEFPNLPDRLSGGSQFLERGAQLILPYYHHHTKARVECPGEFGLSMEFRVSVSQAR